jgi:two-component system, OmpR family, sensor histidine kinase KdpD
MVPGLIVAVAGSVLVTAVASIPERPGPTVPALLYLLTVIAATATGSVWSGLVAAGLSFAGLDYFFTPPIHKFVVGKPEDLIALAVFLLVAAVVSAVLSISLQNRSMAEFREHQVRALYHLTARLLSGAGLDSVLHDLATALQTLYRLRGCRILVTGPDGAPHERATVGTIGGEPISIPLTAEGREVGRIEMSLAYPGALAGREADVLQAFAGQLALALERARLGEEAAEARVDAEASRIRAALFSSVTHDLRTPLASITASASSLLEEGVPFSEEQRTELLRTILEESERLNRLVGNIMDLSRLRAGALVPAKELIPLDDLASSVLERLRPRLAGRPVRVVVREHLPPVPVDVLQMDQALTNLLENAIRFSPPGAEIAMIAVRWQDMVEVRVADRGPGISVEDRHRVFEEFYRRDVDGHRGGTGLGLTIAQAVILAHGGSMWIEDTPGGGTTVGFRLPLGSGTDVSSGGPA